MRASLMVMAGFGHQVILCPLHARAAALEVLYRQVPEAVRDHLIVEVLDEADRGQLDLSGLWVARKRTGQIVGALLTQGLAGRAAAVWAPEVVPTWCRGKLAASLVATALVDLKARGFQIAQAMLDESAPAHAAHDLRRGGMPYVTDLLYLDRELTGELPPVDGVEAQSTRDQLSSRRSIFNWRAFEPALEGEFRSVLRATYLGSLDMPELEGTRSLDDIIASHRDAGRFVPDRWRLGRIPDRPNAAAVLLLADAPSRDAWEVVYLGLTPEARGRGLGRVVLEHAIERAQGHTPRLELAVDCRNIPATRLYQSAGFTIRDRREVHLAILGERIP
jgi:mycothiol synthase